MNINILIDYLIISATVSIAINYIARNIAKRNNILVDLPDRSRKFHKRPTPLTGGLSIFLSLLISAKLYIDLNELNGFIPLSAEIGNAISNDGDALFPAIALAPKAAIIATAYSAIPAFIFAYGYMFLFE